MKLEVALEKLVVEFGRIADSLEQLTTMARFDHGLTKEESLSVPWVEQEERKPSRFESTDPNDADTWHSTMTDQLSFELEEEELKKKHA